MYNMMKNKIMLMIIIGLVLLISGAVIAQERFKTKGEALDEVRGNQTTRLNNIDASLNTTTFVGKIVCEIDGDEEERCFLNYKYTPVDTGVTVFERLEISNDSTIEDNKPAIEQSVRLSLEGHFDITASYDGEDVDGQKVISNGK